MKKCKIMSLILVAVLFAGLLPVRAAALDDPETAAEAVVLMDADTGDVLFEKNGGQTQDPADISMLMTALLVSESVDAGQLELTDTVIAAEGLDADLAEDSVTADPAIRPGEEMTVEELLYCVLLGSAADACNTLAEYVSGSVTAFVDEMNQRAEELGCTGTSFRTAHGQGTVANTATPRDLALIARAAVSSNTLLNICGEQAHTVPATNMADARNLQNPNQLMNAGSGYYYEYAYGLKNGYAPESGYSLAAAADYDDMNIIAVVMGCAENGGQFAEGIDMLEWVFDNFSYRTILSATDTLATVPVEMGTTDSTGVRAETAIRLMMPNDREIGELRYQVTYYHEQEGTSLIAPVNAGDALGEVTVIMDGEEYGVSRLVATATVDMSRVEYLRSQIRSMIQTPAVRQLITILIIILAIYLLLVIFYCVQRVRHLRSLRMAKKDRAIAMARQETEWLDIPDDESGDGPGIEFFDADRGDMDQRPRHAARQEDDSYFDSFFK